MKSTGKSYKSAVSIFAHIFGDGDAVDGKQILTGMLKSYYGVSDERIGEILAEGRTQAEIDADIANLDKERVKALSSKGGTEKFQEGYKKAKSEVLTAAEKAKRERYGVPDDVDLKGEALDDYIIEMKLKESGATGEDAIRKSPTYTAAEKKWRAELDKLKNDYEGQISQIQTAQQRAATLSAVSKLAIGHINGKKPVVSKNPEVAATQQRNFVAAIADYEYTLDDAGKVTAISKDGKVLEDGHGNNLSWEAHIDKISGSHYEFAANNGGSNAGNNNDGGNGGSPAYPAGITKPKDAKELASLLNSGKLKSSAEKRIVMDEYKKRMGTA